VQSWHIHKLPYQYDEYGRVKMGNRIDEILRGSSGMTDEQQSIESGMNGHIAKPIEIEELFTVLHRYLD
jgi:hypothetical protein